MNDICSVYAIFGSAEEAERISRAMVERRLAACANILGPCRSVYRWDGAVTED
ncbi:MAG: divalent cation tolerance protein CutA, partial [Parasphingopyxis sp.]|uniref:divalent-cation tolerance protein CutA n=1 Tax=Parasphingopyxis sp. TaxID=1920299 RepID=UPI0032EDC265